MISWQFSIILQLLCIVIAVFLFIAGIVKLIEIFRNLGKIKLSKRL